jgi:hypothetical protein
VHLFLLGAPTLPAEDIIDNGKRLAQKVRVRTVDHG